MKILAQKEKAQGYQYVCQEFTRRLGVAFVFLYVH